MKCNWGIKAGIFSIFLALQGCGGEEAPGSNHTPVAGDCNAPADQVLTDIDSVTNWVNAMPKPLSLPCFVKSLPRPMLYSATLSQFSAQPSLGKRSPRLFFTFGKLVLTVVPAEAHATVKDPETGETSQVWDKDGIQLLELSYEVESDHIVPQSIKGELKFPITGPLPRYAPYDKIDFSSALSVCAFCHGRETLIEEIEGVPVYRSIMLRNDRSAELAIDFMLGEYAVCDPTVSKSEAYRCEMLEAIYGQGDLIWSSFRKEIEVF